MLGLEDHRCFEYLSLRWDLSRLEWLGFGGGFGRFVCSPPKTIFSVKTFVLPALFLFGSWKYLITTTSCFAENFLVGHGGERSLNGVDVFVVGFCIRRSMTGVHHYRAVSSETKPHI